MLDLPPLEQLIACPDCDLLMLRPKLVYNQLVFCPCCGRKLYLFKSDVPIKSLALIVAALLLYIPANFYPIMSLNIMGHVSIETVWTGFISLYDSGMLWLSVLVFLCSMAIPLIKLFCQLFVILVLLVNKYKSYGIYIYRVYHHLRDWGMLEVYLLGILVSIVKLGSLAVLQLGVGFICFASLLLIQIYLEFLMSPEQIWTMLSDGESL